MRDDKALQSALSLHVAGRLDEALKSYELLLAVDPRNPDLLHYFGLARLQSGDVVAAMEYLKLALELRPADSLILSNFGHCLCITGDLESAEDACLRATEADPRNDAAWSNLANCLRLKGRLSEAERYYRRALSISPRNVSTRCSLGGVLQAQDKFAEAFKVYMALLNEGVDDPGFQIDVINCLAELGDVAKARAMLLSVAGRIPGDARLLLAGGRVAAKVGELSISRRLLQRSIAFNTTDPAAHVELAQVLKDLRDFSTAEDHFDIALSLDSSSAEALNGKGSLFSAQRYYGDALECYKLAVRKDPGHYGAWINIGNTLFLVEKYAECIEAYTEALRLDSTLPLVEGTLLQALLSIARWDGFEDRLAAFRERLQGGSAVVQPFVSLVLFDDPLLSLSMAKGRNPLGGLPFDVPPYARLSKDASKFRVGYFSMDFHEHPVARLIVGLIEEHNKDEFEVVGVSYGPQIDCPIRRRLVSAFDSFIDVSGMGIEESISLVRGLHLDVAVDLAGHTRGSRQYFFSARVAPVQINYLGYPGSSGNPEMDYLLADRTIVHETSRRFYTESVIYLPDSYQVNDIRRGGVTEPPQGRSHFDLPIDCFVFCCFNSLHKILPNVFSSWLSILKASSSSILWLLVEDEEARGNLRRVFERNSVDPARLVFADRLGQAEHISRISLADLFLDTYPYGAHTTASDALWAALPLITLAGESFQSLVGASLLRSVGLERLIARNWADYERLAVGFAENPSELEKIREYLREHRYSFPLFDTRRTAKNIEAAYKSTIERSRLGLAPQDVFIESETKLFMLKNP